MRRMAFIAGAALPGILLVTLLSCSSDLGEEIGNGTGNGTGPTASAGRYSTLPEPCGAVDRELLTALLPETDEETLAGVPAATFNTARRVGCVWEVPGARGTHRLSVDFLRVVSYDPEVSDEEQAGREFEAAAESAGLEPRAEREDGAPEGGADSARDGSAASPSPGEGDTGGGDGTDGDTRTEGTADTDTEDPGARDPEETDSDGEDGETDPDAEDTDEGTEPPDDGDNDETPDDNGTDGDRDNGDGDGEDGPRRVENLGEEAWLDDRLATDANGDLREIVVTFRTSNAIVTVTLTEDFGSGGPLPREAETLDRAVELARRLAGRFEG
ncbi:hypothetical protein FNQ90_15575 [Streptomyces alkaliphilus]|uniref:DUF3558 domain-containing protein n=1 Tax=Streptomyces alkaliphilus TaxID=1472722 RepID=A0A7W3Y283_9ACTN|nr:hypothetical protein [Streptomyces alkaliphilus]MBB0245484.1 hypothetical protein [Streptomyces alkaliphilus]